MEKKTKNIFLIAHKYFRWWRKNMLYIRIAYYLHRAKEITKKVYHNVMNSVLYLIQIKWILYLWVLKNSKISDPHINYPIL